MRFDTRNAIAAAHEMLDVQLHLPEAGDTLTADELGEAIVQALVPTAAPQACTLRSVVLGIAGAAVTLAPEEAMAHGFVGPWTAPNLKGALAQAITAGADLSYLFPNSPQWLGLELVDRGSAGLSATTAVQFATDHGPLTVSAVFGCEPTNTARMVCHSITGSALLNIGRGAFGAGSAAVVTEAEPAVAAVPAPGETRH